VPDASTGNALMILEADYTGPPPAAIHIAGNSNGDCNGNFNVVNIQVPRSMSLELALSDSGYGGTWSALP
jgi:hypothetical protein